MAKIDDIKIQVPLSQTEEISNDIPERPVEDGTHISDHIFVNNVVINEEFVIAGKDADDRKKELKEKVKDGKIHTYTDVKNLKKYENMGIENISFSTDSSISNGYTGRFTMKQIEVVRKRTAEIEMGNDPATGNQPQSEDESVIGDTYNEIPGKKKEEHKAEISEEEVDKSLLKHMTDWLFGGDEE